MMVKFMRTIHKIMTQINLCWTNKNCWANVIKNLDRNILDARNIVQCAENSAMLLIMSMKNLKIKDMSVRMDIRCKGLVDPKISKIILLFCNHAMKSKIKTISSLMEMIYYGKTLSWIGFLIGALILRMKMRL